MRHLKKFENNNKRCVLKRSTSVIHKFNELILTSSFFIIVYKLKVRCEQLQHIHLERNDILDNTCLLKNPMDEKVLVGLH